MPAARTKTKKIAPEIDAKIWDEFVAVAKQNEQSHRYVLEKDLTQYLSGSSRATAIFSIVSPSKWRTFI